MANPRRIILQFFLPFIKKCNQKSKDANKEYGKRKKETNKS